MVSLSVSRILQKPQASRITTLPVAVGPLDPLPELREAKILSRSGYTLPGKPEVGGVFRYSIQADLEAFLKTLQAGRKAKDGWKVSRRPAARVFFERNVPQGRLANQTFLLQRARIVADPAGRGGIRVIPATKAPGWVWISYNEHVRMR